jgi:hypothetical protein
MLNLPAAGRLVSASFQHLPFSIFLSALKKIPKFFGMTLHSVMLNVPAVVMLNLFQHLLLVLKIPRSSRGEIPLCRTSLPTGRQARMTYAYTDMLKLPAVFLNILRKPLGDPK